MKKIILLSTALISLIFTGCSVFFLDVNNLTKTKAYSVNHLKEVKAEYDENGIQTNLTKDDDGNIVLSYETAETESLKGPVDDESAAKAKTYEGFTAQKFSQITLSENGPDSVEIKYNRNESTISFDTNGGLWDFDSAKTDKEIKSFTRKYGSDLPEISFASLGKRFCTLKGWKDTNGNMISSLPETFPAESVIYTAEWENNGGTAWKIRYLFEPADSTDSEDFSAYVTDDAHPDEVQYAQAGETTVVHIAEDADGSENEVIAVPFDGFTLAKNIEQKTVAEDGSTVVEVYYKRNEYSILLNPGKHEDSDAVWNYAEVKAGTEEADKESKTITGKFGSSVDYSSVSGAGVKGCVLTGWKAADGTVTEKLPETMPLNGGEYTAVWTKLDAVSYKVEHWFEKVTSIDSEDLSNYEINKDYTQPDLKGYPEDMTAAAAESVEGFTALAITQQEIKADGSTVVKVYYKRNVVTVTLNIGGGYWNYKQYKADQKKSADQREEIEPDSADKTFSGKYGQALDTASTLGNAGKASNGIDRWYKSPDTDNLVELPSIFPAENAYYTAHWSQSAAYQYRVEHWFEKANSTDPSVEDVENYEQNLDAVPNETLSGLPDTNTNAVPKTDVTGFYYSSEKHPVAQQEIEENGTTVIRIYYERVSVTLTYSTGDTAAYWNYKLWKADQENVEPDTSDKTLTGKYGTDIEYGSMLTNAGKKSCSIEKWQIDDAANYTQTLPSEFPAENVKYTAVWVTAADVNYTVEHWFEKTTCTDITDESAVSYTKDGDYTETKKGTPETNTAAEAKNVTGFTAKQVKQQEIDSSGNTVVKIYYVRNSIDITFNPDEGIWNYDAWKANKSGVTPNQTVKTVSGKYGTVISYPEFNMLKKIGKNLSGFSYLDGEETKTITVEALKNITVFPASAASYTAVWTDKAQVSYTIKHWTEMVTSDDAGDASNYELNGTDATKKGIPEYYTEAAYKTINGFEPRDTTITQEEIAEDGSTVVNLYYKRSIHKITFDSNGGIWNYSEYKNNGAAAESDNLSVEGKYGTAVTLPAISGVGKTSYNLKGWTSTGGSTAETLPSVFGTSDVTYSAIWELASGYKYTVKHLFQNVDASAYVENETLRETGAGVKDEYTEAVPKTVTGFTAVTPVTQVVILEDNSAVVEIKYTRNSSNFIFDPNGGTISGSSTISGRYESEFAAASTPTAAKSGWTFAGWKLNGELVSDSNNQLKNQYYGASDVTYTAYWVAELTVGTVSSFGDISLVISDNTSESKYECSVTLPTGLEAKEWTYKWYVDTVYTADGSEFTRTYSALGKGKHTITVKAVHNANSFTARKTVSVN